MTLSCLLGLAPAPARASGIDLFSPDTLSAVADMRAITTNGERSWERGDFGKLRYGDEAGLRPGNADLVWQPKLGWVLSATVTASAFGGPRPVAGISEAFFTVRPRLAGPARAWARIGFVWAPASLEHTGADWHVADAVTPSAINSWIGEEVRPLAAEANLDVPLGAGRFTTTAALFTANDTAGALLAMRGWALHDRKTLLGHAQPLPPLPRRLGSVQPPYTHPTIYLGEGFARRPGYYLKLAWQPAAPFRLELFHYANRADPEDVNAELEWGWDTQFNQLAAEFRLDQSTAFKAQALAGRTVMGFANSSGQLWVDTRFRSAFGLLTRSFPRGGVALRGELFETTQRGSRVTVEDDEHGWAVTLAAHRDLGQALTLWVEGLHIASRRPARMRAGLDPAQRQDQVQLVLRGLW